MVTKIKIFIFFTIASFCLFSYYSLYAFQMGAPVKAEWWLKEVIVKKTDLLSKIDSPERIIIISGSNSLMGFDSSVIEKGTGIPTFNFGLHASLDMNYLSKIANGITRPGDIFIAPLEYSFYLRENRYSDWFINNMLGWGSDYLSGLGFIDKLMFFTHTEAKRVFEGLFATPRKVMASEHDIKRFIPNGEYRGYSYKSIKQNGDITTPDSSTNYVIDLVSSNGQVSNMLSYQSDKSPQDYSISQIVELKKTIESKGGKLIIIWPVSIESKLFNKNNESSTRFINSIKSKMMESGIKVHCNPYEFNIPHGYFFDTYYHLNREGEKIRSAAVMNCLKREKLLPIHGL
ncbi:hypothetical protein [Cronobacter dublinensis]|uniref:hypothetical protein n=1 Tax=Cronobacter dublinensis TaxID=413497 RepID=UPI00300E6A7D